MRDNILPMAHIELTSDPIYGDLLTGPAPIVSGSRFRPMEEIRLEVSCRDGLGQTWKSVNSYLADGNGVFDTSTTPAIGESYYGVAPEGPFTAMTCELGSGHDFVTNNLTQITYTLTCFQGNARAWSQQLTRYVHRKVAYEPWIQALLFDDVVGPTKLDVASALASYGISVVNRPSSKHTESFDPASTSDDSDLPTFIVGSGRASTRALEAAIRLPNIRAVVLFSGSGLRFEPILSGPSGVSTHDNAEITEPGYIDLSQSSMPQPRDGFLRTRTLYAEAVADRQQRERARIAVENIACPIYLFSGGDDQIWPSAAFSELIAQKRLQTGCPFITSHRTFEGVGHDLGPSLGWPTLPTTERSIAHPDIDARLLLGGKMGRQARARRECWDSLLRILFLSCY